jgi:molybdate-binding protein
MSEEKNTDSVVIAVFTLMPETGDIDMQVHNQVGFAELATMNEMLGSELRARGFMTIADIVSTVNAKGLAALLRSQKETVNRQVDELKTEIEELSK